MNETPSGRFLRTTPPQTQTDPALESAGISADLPFIEDVQPPKPEEPKPPALGIFVHAVVQVFNPASPYYGVLFIIGDVKDGKVHGFHMLAGGRKEYVTVGTDDCYPIGVSKSRSKDPCSPQWKTDHKMA